MQVIKRPTTIHTAALMQIYLIVVTGQFRDEANVLRSDGLHPTLNGHGGFVFLLLSGARPLGAIEVSQLPHPVSESDLNVAIEGSYWKELGHKWRKEMSKKEGRMERNGVCLCESNKERKVNKKKKILNSKQLENYYTLNSLSIRERFSFFNLLMLTTLPSIRTKLYPIA